MAFFFILYWREFCFSLRASKLIGEYETVLLLIFARRMPVRRNIRQPGMVLSSPRTVHGMSSTVLLLLSITTDRDLALPTIRVRNKTVRFKTPHFDQKGLKNHFLDLGIMEIYEK